MTLHREEKVELGLERLISYVLTGGVILSLTLEVAGLILYFNAYHSFAVSFDSASMIQGHNFFSYVFSLFSKRSGSPAIQLITIGIAMLLLTPYLRVVLSAIFFAWERNYKFVLITVFVLVVLTVSLIRH